jgi:hypothetical protein
MSNQIVGNVGLYYVCYRLSSLGWNVMPTARNARGIDIIIYSQDAKRTLTIQVKALSKRAHVPLGRAGYTLFGNFFIVCRDVASTKPECFILVPEEVKRLAHRSRPTVNGISYWLQTNAYDKNEFRETWDKIGTGAPVSMLPDKTPS